MSEYQYYEFAAIDRPLTRAGMAKLRAFITPTTLSVESSDTHWILDWALEESEDYDRFAQDDGSGWMRRLIPLRDELLRGDLRPLYLGWLAAGDALDDDAQEPDVPPGLAELSPAQQALVEFLEIDPDLLEAASTGSAAPMPADDDEARLIIPWLDTWQIADMKDVLRRLALGHGQEAQRQVKSRYAAWLKAQRPAAPDSPRRRVAELRELARSAAANRRAREAKAHAKREAERRRQHEAGLRQLMAAPDASWNAADTQAARGIASGYDEATRILVELAEGYALVSSREAFDRTLLRFLIPHAKRAALLRRLTDAGLCK